MSDPVPVFRTPREAFAAAVADVTRVYLCVTNAYIDARTSVARENGLFALALNRSDLVRLRAPVPLALTMRQYLRAVRIEHGWYIRLAAYWYALRDERHEILAYHWHPEQTPNVPFPHLHLEAGAGIQRDELTRAHLPTGFVPLAAVLRLTITDFGAEPLRDDWQETLVHTEATTREQSV